MNLPYNFHYLIITFLFFTRISTAEIIENTTTANIRKYGRNFETETIINGVLATKGIKGLLSYVSDGFAMLRKGKLGLRPEKVKEMGQIGSIFEALEEK